jgi:DNA mismatch repair protein MutS2
MRYFLKVANKRSLLLLDEFGTGSDPDLGGALAEVFFEELYKKLPFAVITTHYANIKLRADQLPNAINGCMLFNTDSLEPLYKLSMGQPGSSFTFEVAQMNGIPLDLIEKAKGKLDENKVKMDRLLNELQKEKTYLERLTTEHITAQERAEKARVSYEERKEKFEDRLHNQQDFIEKNNVFLNAGKKMKGFIDRYQTMTKKKTANQALLEEVRKYLLVEKSKVEEAKKKTQLIQASTTKTTINPKRKKKQEAEVDTFQRDKIKVGSKVQLIDTKQKGIVEEMKGPILMVVFGNLRMKIDIEKLQFVPEK